MKTVKVDEWQRIRLPELKPGQVLAIEELEKGCFALRPVKPEDHGLTTADVKRMLAKKQLSLDVEIVETSIFRVPNACEHLLIALCREPAKKSGPPAPVHSRD